jgi:hypothetical protein
MFLCSFFACSKPVTFFVLKFILFISFAPPKEMNQRKRGRNRAVGELGEAKCQLQPKRAPATLALMALPFWLQFTPFPVLPARQYSSK